MLFFCKTLRFLSNRSLCIREFIFNIFSLKSRKKNNREEREEIYMYIYICFNYANYHLTIIFDLRRNKLYVHLIKIPILLVITYA